MGTAYIIPISVGTALVLSVLFILPGIRKQGYLDRLFQKGSQCIRWELWDQALGCFQEILLRLPRDAQVHYNLGFILYHGKNLLDPAIQELQKAIDLDPQMAAGHYTYGHLLLHALGNDDLSTKHLKISLSINPNQPQVYNTLGQLEIKRQQWSSAMTCFQKAISIAPDFENAYGNLAITCLYLGRNADAVRYAEKHVELQPANPLARKNLGNIYGAVRKLDKAEKEFKTVRSITPDDWVIHFWLGCVYFQQRKFEAAVSSFYEALGLRSGFALTHYNLALCFEELHDSRLARDHIDKAIEIDPSLGKGLLPRKEENEALHKPPM